MDTTTGQSLGDVWREKEGQHGDDLFLIHESAAGAQEFYTYSEFHALIDRTATALHEEFGVEQGDHVAVHLPNCTEILQCYFALAKLGAVTVFSDVENAVRESRYMFDVSDSTLVVTDSTHEEHVEEASDDTGVERIVLTGAEADAGDSAVLDGYVEAAARDLPAVDVEHTDTAVIMFTSGTTADPKPVVCTHAFLQRIGREAAAHLALRPDDRYCVVLPVYHGNGQYCSVMPTLVSGGTLVLLEEFSSTKFVDQLRRHDATITSLVPTPARALLKRPRNHAESDNDLRVINFAINLDEDERDEFTERLDTPLVPTYGASENGMPVYGSVYDDPHWPSTGRATLGREVHILDEGHDPVGPGEKGEIAIGGTPGLTLFKEYYGMPDRTENAFTDDGLFLTGDIGWYDEEGYIYYAGRKKEIIKSRGMNVSLKEVEQVIEEHEQVDEVGAIGIDHEVYNQVVKAFVKPSDPSLSAETLHAHAEEQLSEFKRPAEIEFVEEFPRTSIGKIEKKALRGDDGD